MNIGEKIDLNAIGKRSFSPVELINAMRKGAMMTVMSWGAHAWMVNKDLWLRFMVQGHHHNGHVYIVLDWNDTFIVYFTTSRGKIVDKKEGVYIDVLVQVIDERVEKIDDYVR